jgi:error-prone DNA polymerase
LFEEAAWSEDAATLPDIPPAVRVRHDYAATGLSLKAHPVSFLRDQLAALKITPARALADQQRYPHGKRVAVAGLVLVRQRPGTASGIVFFTIEDETGIANLIVRPEVFERYRTAGKHSTILGAWGRVERQGEVVHVQTLRLASLDALGDGLTARSRDFH